MGQLIERIAIWWRQATCNHVMRVARFKIIEEIGIGYWECPVDRGGCGAEWEE